MGERVGGSVSGEDRPRIRINDRRRVRPEDVDDAEGRPQEEPDEGRAVGERGDPEPPPAPTPEGREGSDLETARDEAAAYLDDLKRLKAEFENYRKRVVKEQTEVIERATIGLIGRLLGVLDNFELAGAAAEESRDFERMLKGVEMVFGELKEVLASEGLERLDAKGKPFDPNLHEAALEIPGDGSQDDSLVVVEELRPGYTFRGRVLRAAMVKVARRSGGDEAE